MFCWNWRRRNNTVDVKIVKVIKTCSQATLMLCVDVNPLTPVDVTKTSSVPQGTDDVDVTSMVVKGLMMTCVSSTDTLCGKVVWITGASSGIGEHIAYQLAAVGCKLVLSARRKEELIRVKEGCLQCGQKNISDDDVLVLPLDVVEFETHKASVQQVLAHFKKIDILVNNAGRFQCAPWTDVDLNVDREIFEIDVLGQVSLTQAVLPHMIERKEGHIAVMSSLAGRIVNPLSRSYCGSKHALHGYFDVLRYEMVPHNIDVTMICPGPVVSELLTNAVGGKKGEKLPEVTKKFNNVMSTQRCAYLSCVAIANRMYEVWMSDKPYLWFTYASVYLNDFTTCTKKTRFFIYLNLGGSIIIFPPRPESYVRHFLLYLVRIIMALIQEIHKKMLWF